MTNKLDKSRRYGTVVGASNGAVYYQDGIQFRGDGTPVGEPAAQAAPPPAPVVQPPPADDSASREDLQALHPSQIKKLVEDAGLTLETGAGSKKRNIENLLAAG